MEQHRFHNLKISALDPTYTSVYARQTGNSVLISSTIRRMGLVGSGARQLARGVFRLTNVDTIMQSRMLQTFDSRPGHETVFRRDYDFDPIPRGTTGTFGMLEDLFSFSTLPYPRQQCGFFVQTRIHFSSRLQYSFVA